MLEGTPGGRGAGRASRASALGRTQCCQPGAQARQCGIDDGIAQRGPLGFQGHDAGLQSQHFGACG